MRLIYLSTFQIYNHLAEYLTELEMWRTQTQFDDSLTLKIYLLQFVNYYASIFYIAFFKGKFVGHPGKYITVFHNRQEEVSDKIFLLFWNSFMFLFWSVLRVAAWQSSVFNWLL